MPTLDAFAALVLKRDKDLWKDPAEIRRVIEEAEKKFRPTFKASLTSTNTRPVPDILGFPIGVGKSATTVMGEWTEAFSTTLSPAVHLFGSPETKEIETYNNAFKAYFARLLDKTEALLSKIELNDADLTTPIFRNLHVKLQWLQLGYFPTDEERIKTETPVALFSPTMMHCMMSLWHSKGIKVVDFSESRNFGPALAEVCHLHFF